MQSKGRKKSGATPHPDGYVVVPVRLYTTSYHKLRKLSYLSEKPYAQIIREAVDDKIEKERKVLQNSDIVI